MYICKNSYHHFYCSLNQLKQNTDFKLSVCLYFPHTSFCFSLALLPGILLHNVNYSIPPILLKQTTYLICIYIMVLYLSFPSSSIIDLVTSATMNSSAFFIYFCPQCSQHFSPRLHCPQFLHLFNNSLFNIRIHKKRSYLQINFQTISGMLETIQNIHDMYS